MFIMTLGAKLVPYAESRGRNGSAAYRRLSEFHDQEKHMNRFGSLCKPLMWFMALLLAAVVAGCGDGDSSGAGAGGGGGGAFVGPPTTPGAGTGAGGLGKGPLPVNLGAAGNFVILAKSGISTVPTSAITGNLGLSPAAASLITGFSLILPPAGASSTSAQVTGQVFASDYAPPTPVNLTTAVSDMMLAYTDAAGRAPDYTELGAGQIGGRTLAPATYKWGSGVLISTDVTLSGGANDVWIFEIAQDLTVANGKKMILAGGAQAKNIFWAVAGGTGVAIGTTAHVEGVILAVKGITLNTGATANSRLLAQTAVTLVKNTVTQPAP